MIRSFKHKGLELFFRLGSKKGIQPKHAAKLRIQLAALDNAKMLPILGYLAGGCMLFREA